jgi:RNA polymerase sigma-70 factor (ECF subfamily)
VQSRPGKDARDDQALIRAANGGDAAAFDALYLRYRDWVVSLAQRFTGNHEDALDVMQDTFAYLLGKFPGFVLTCRMTTFLYPVVRSGALTRLRKAGREVADDELLALAPTRDELDARHDDLAQLLAALPAAQREVVLMRFVDGLTLAEIAEAMHVPVGTVKSRLHNGLARLRRDPRVRKYFEP